MKNNRIILLFLAFLILLLPLSALAEEHTHIFKEELVEPTCSEEGYYYSYCEICGYSEDGKIILPKTNHTFGNWQKDINPSCVTTGREVRFCSVCNGKDYRILPATSKHIPYVAYRFPATQYSSGEVVEMCKSCNIILNKNIFQRINSIKLSKGKYVYNGKKRKPKVTVRDADNKTVPKKNFKLTYDKNAKNVGTHNVDVLFINDYYGYYVLTYDVIPRKCEIKRVKSENGKIRINVKSIYPESDGIIISYSSDKTFKNAKNIKSKNKDEIIINGLKKNKTYYVRAKSYSVVNKKKYYSKWTEIQKVKIR